ncbi:DUF2179 domain-containing protein [Candidatus Sumerlaeota bacterium]|nr:DUF2179 domain-containing protein [Candidatus Sumerlaeota bacterium]
MGAELLYLFFARTADMCLATLRHLFAVRGLRFAAAGVAFLEVMIYLFALRMILAQEMGALRMGVFASGYALGVFLGTFVDERLALGTRLVQVVVDSDQEELITYLRRKLPVTAWKAEGRDGPKQVLQIHVRRRDQKKLIRRIRDVAPNAFILDMEPRSWTGGIIKLG